MSYGDVPAGSYNHLTPVLSTASPTSPRTGSATLIGYGPNRQLALWVMATNDPVVSAVSMGTDALALIAGTERGQGAYHIEVWGGPLTVEGSQTATITFGVSPTRFACYGVVVWFSDLINHGDSTGNAASPLARTIVSDSPDDFVAFAFVGNNTALATASPPLWGQEGGGGATNTLIGDAWPNATITITKGAADWTLGLVALVNFRAVKASPGVTAFPKFLMRPSPRAES